jgi:hypothetical protein
VEIEITPEPDPAERAALLRALAAADDTEGEPPVYRSPWRRAALEPEDED